MMKRIQFLLFIVMLSSCKAVKTQKISYDSIVLKAKETSLYSDQVNWVEVNTRFIELTRGKKDVEEMKPGLQYLINSLGDKHATFRSLKDYSIIVSYTGHFENNDKRARDSEFVNTVINDVTAQFSYKKLDCDVGYLRVVGIGPGDVKAQADFIRKGLIDLKAEGVEKWILDLRFNGGGNIEPMVSGLAPLLGDGFIGGAVNNQNEVTRTYKVENGQFNHAGRIACQMNNQPTMTSTEKVAVLLSRYTTSSGELLAVVFKGRENTRFIGEKTSGYTTGNGFDPVTDELALVISQDVFMDRNRIRYDDKVDVDEEIEFQSVVDLKNDKQVIRAIEWLR
jgi:C-terminal processing protease CtpA/Prc